MSKRFSALNENNKNENNKKDNDKKENNNKDNNIFKSNRFSSLSEKKEQPNNSFLSSSEKKEKTNNRFQILMEDKEEKVVEIKTKQVKYNNQTYVKEEPIIIKEDNTIDINLFPTLGTSKCTNSISTIDFKSKLLEKENCPYTEKKQDAIVINLNNDKESELARQELARRVNQVMSQIICEMELNGERQRHFYDSIYGDGMYDWEYEKMIDKYEVLYGKDSWQDYTNMDICYGYTSESDYNYEDTTLDRYDIDIDYEKKLNNWL